MRTPKMVLSFFLSLILISLFKPDHGRGDPLQIVMDDYPPFSYEEKGEIKGLSTQVLKAALDKAGLTAKITQYPFARAYAMTQEGKNIFEYCVARTPEREKLFQWIGIVAIADHGLLSLKGKEVKITKFEDLKNYFIGTVYEDLVDQYLRVRVSQYGLRLDRVSTYELNMKKLLNKRFDLYGGNFIVGRYFAQKLGGASDSVKEVYKFNDLSVPYYLVTGPATDPELVKKLKAAFDEIHRNGTYQSIADKYFKEDR